MQRYVRVSVVQAMPDYFNKEGCLEKVVSLTKDAAATGAKIVFLPESFIPGYPDIFNYGLKDTQFSDEWKSLYQLYFDNSISDDGPEVYRLSQIAAENQIYLVIGITERDKARLYCSTLFFGPDGSLLGKHRKLKPTGFEQLLWSEGDDELLAVIKTPYGRMGSAICWENYMPLLRAAMYSKSVGLYVTPTADCSPHWQSTIQHIALEGRCFVISCNNYLNVDMLENDSFKKYFLPHNENSRYQRGGSAIISPTGEYLAGPLFDEEGILTVDLDLEQIYESRYDFDPLQLVIPNDFKEICKKSVY